MRRLFFTGTRERTQTSELPVIVNPAGAPADPSFLRENGL
jgi:hypothetical protein